MTLDDKKHIHVWQDSNHDPRFEFCARCGVAREKDWSEPSGVDDKKLSEILDTVFANGITRGQQYAEGTGANTLMSDTLYTAKQALNRHYGGLLMEIIGGAESEMKGNYHFNGAIVRNKLRAELTASLKQRLGLK